VPTVTLIGEATDAEDGPAACADLLWDIRLGHNSHAHPLTVLSGCEVTFRALGPEFFAQFGPEYAALNAPVASMLPAAPTPTSAPTPG